MAPECALAAAVIDQAYRDLTSSHVPTTSTARAEVERNKTDAIAFFTGGQKQAVMRNFWFAFLGLDEEHVYRALKPHLGDAKLSPLDAPVALDDKPVIRQKPFRKAYISNPPRTEEWKDAKLFPMFKHPIKIQTVFLSLSGEVGDSTIRNWVNRKIEEGRMREAPEEDRGLYVVVEHLEKAA